MAGNGSIVHRKRRKFVNLLIEIRLNKNISTVIVFLANKPEATSRYIERGTDMRQPEASLA
ncbi:MAG: hypothetical protein PHT99_08890 [Methanoregula sp.]|nr:hypothetical protein [Methanoregula sp.]